MPARLQKDEVRRHGLLDALQDLELERIGSSPELLALVAGLSCTYGATGFDAIFAASARFVGGCR